MRRPEPLPVGLGRAFRVSTAVGSGVTPGRLRGTDLAHPYVGARTLDEHPVLSYIPLLRPGDRFSHTTAARLWGAPTDAQPQIHVTASGGDTRVRRPGVTGHQSRVGSTVIRLGVPVSDPITTLVECSTLLGIDALVQLGDYLVLTPRFRRARDPRPFADLGALRTELEQRHGPGVRRARQAAALVRAGAESAAETRLRLLLQRAGLPEPVLGYELVDVMGQRVGWFDLAWPAVRVIVEYDGDQHRTSTEQYELDIVRYDLATALGWRVIRVRMRGLNHDPAGTIQRVRAAFAASI